MPTAGTPTQPDGQGNPDGTSQSNQDATPQTDGTVQNTNTGSDQSSAPMDVNGSQQ